MNGPSRKRLVDALMEAYVSWREACLQVSDAYRSWAGETGLRAASAFARYTAALDREERAAEVYAGLIRRAGQLDLSRPDSAQRLGEAARRVGSRAA
jgi:hypothetical protein